MEDPQKITNRVTKWPSNLSYGCLLKKNLNTLICKDICTPMFTAALFTVANTWKQPKCPSIDDWIEKIGNICSMEYYCSYKKVILWPFATIWMDLENIMLSEISQSGKAKNQILSLICGI